MNWNTLRYVVEIAEQKSFSKAARKLYLAQPSLSQSIRALEQELGTPLFDRTRSPLRGSCLPSGQRKACVHRNRRSDALPMLRKASVRGWWWEFPFRAARIFFRV